MQGIRSRFLKSAFRSLQNCYSPSLSIVIPDCLVHFNLSLFFSLHRTWPCPQKASNKVFVEVRHGTVTLLQALSCPHSHTLMEQLSSSWTVNLATPLLSPLAAFSSTSHTPLVKLNGFFSFTEGFSLSVSISPVYCAPPVSLSCLWAPISQSAISVIPTQHPLQVSAFFAFPGPSSSWTFPFLFAACWVWLKGFPSAICSWWADKHCSPSSGGSTGLPASCSSFSPCFPLCPMGFQGGAVVKNSPVNAGDSRDMG